MLCQCADVRVDVDADADVAVLLLLLLLSLVLLLFVLSQWIFVDTDADAEQKFRRYDDRRNLLIGGRTLRIGATCFCCGCLRVVIALVQSLGAGRCDSLLFTASAGRIGAQRVRAPNFMGGPSDNVQ